jgi:hypothetical protein
LAAQTPTGARPAEKRCTRQLNFLGSDTHG